MAASAFEAAFKWIDRHENAKTPGVKAFAAKQAVKAMGSDAEAGLPEDVLADAGFYNQ